MNYLITTYQDNERVLGTDFSKIVKNCKTEKKLINAVNLHKQTIRTLMTIKPFLNNQYTIKIEKI